LFLWVHPIADRVVQNLENISGKKFNGPEFCPWDFVCVSLSVVLGGMKAAFVLFPARDLGRARRLDSADVDSCVWLASTRTYIACAVPFIVWIHSGLGS